MVCAWCVHVLLCSGSDDDDSFEADYSFNNWLAKMVEIAKYKMKQFSQSNFLPILLFIRKAMERHASPFQFKSRIFIPPSKESISIESNGLNVHGIKYRISILPEKAN